MAAARGRSFVVRRAGRNVAGVRTKSITINGSPIDITSDDDAGIRKLLDQPGQIDVAIAVSGVLLDDILAAEALEASDRVKLTQFLRSGSPDNGFSGEFFLASYKENGEHQGAVLFEAEFQSAGAVTFA
jgi:TP901-1 family phage major tail protein